MAEEKDKFDPEAKLKELLPSAFDDKGTYKPIYTPTTEQQASVSVSAAPEEYNDISPEMVAAGTGTLGFLAGQKAKMIQQRLAPSSRSAPVAPSTVPPPAPSVPSAPPAASGAPMASGDKWSSKVVGMMGPGGESVTEAARNYRIQQSLTPTESAQFKTNREGIILPNKTEAEQRMMQEAKQKMLMERSKRGAAALGRGMNVATDVAPRLMTGLSAAGAGYQGTEAYNRAFGENRDIPGAVISGVGALGSAASMVPHPVVRGIGTALGIASPLALEVYDRYKGR
jgi:hypothetical protein